MKPLMLILALLGCLFPGWTFAELEPAWGWYARFDTGFSNARDQEGQFLSGSSDPGESKVIGGGFGYTVLPGIRSDVTLTYRSGFEQILNFTGLSTTKAELESFVTLVSLYLDMVTLGRVSPYGGFGIGFSHNKLGRFVITNPDGSAVFIDGVGKTNYASQLCLGVAILVTNRLLLDLGYHRVNAGQYVNDENLRIVLDDPSIAKFRSNEFLVSLQFTF